MHSKVEGSSVGEGSPWGRLNGILDLRLRKIKCFYI